MTSTPLLPPPTGTAGPVAQLDAVGEVLGQIRGTWWPARTGAELLGVVDQCGRLKAVLEAIELAAVRELDVNPAAQPALKDAGWASVKDLVVHADGARRGAGRAAVRLAEALTRYPQVADALGDGWLSEVKARIVVAAVDRLPAEVRDRAVTALLEAARHLCVEDLVTVGRRILAVVDPDGVDAADERDLERSERAAHYNRDLRLRFDRLGGGAGELSGSAEDVALLKTVLMALAAPEPAEPGSCGGDDVCDDLGCKTRGHDGRDTRDHGARMFDALIELARRHQAAGTLPESHGGVPTIIVTTTLDDLRHPHPHDSGDSSDTDDGDADNGSGADGDPAADGASIDGADAGPDDTGAQTDLGDHLDPGTVRRMACDADVVPVVLGTDSAVLDVGRRQRLVTAALWIALVVRDRHCAFPGCRRPPVMCHAHHIRHWVDGGRTSLANLVMLCGAHHRIIHSTPWDVRLRPEDHRPEFRPPGRDDWIRQRRRE